LRAAAAAPLAIGFGGAHVGVGDGGGAGEDAADRRNVGHWRAAPTERPGHGDCENEARHEPVVGAGAAAGGVRVIGVASVMQAEPAV
jgi:hypothetical protein